MVFTRRVNASDKVCINVQGTSYETFESTLNLYPNTLLGDKDARKKYYSQRLCSLYFNVKPELFEAVLFFYQSDGILSKPTFSADAEYTHTLEFFGLVKAKHKDECTENATLRAKVWDVLEHPHKSSHGMCFAYFSFATILISVGLFCGETEIHKTRPQTYHFTSPWFLAECVYITFFTLEYIVRLWSAPNRLRFAVSFLGLIDMFSVVPFFIAVLYQRYAKLSYVRILRLLQILRIIKLSRYNSGLKILAQAILACRKQVFSLAVLFGIVIIFSSTFLYVFEGYADTKGFSSIPETMWFAVISMTTVGYGDVVPKTYVGKFFGFVCIFAGTVVLFHLFLPVYLMYFSFFYKQDKEKRKLKNEQKQRIHRKEIAEYSSKSPNMNYIRKSTALTPRSPVSLCDNKTMDIWMYDSEDFELTVPVRSVNSGASSYLRSGSFL